jgi:hypothetical protein
LIATALTPCFGPEAFPQPRYNFPIHGAYEEANQPHVPSMFLNEVVKIGQSIADATRDQDALGRWSQQSQAEKAENREEKSCITR